MILSLHSHLDPAVLAPPLGQGSVTAFVHTITSSSPSQFANAEPQPAPTPDDADRKGAPPAAQYDVAVVINVLHHVENPDEFFEGMKGLLRDGGRIVIVEPNGLETVPPTGDHVKLELEDGMEEMDIQEVRVHDSSAAACGYGSLSGQLSSMTGPNMEHS